MTSAMDAQSIPSRSLRSSAASNTERITGALGSDAPTNRAKARKQQDQAKFYLGSAGAALLELLGRYCLLRMLDRVIAMILWFGRVNPWILHTS
jgi:hypothetical protein